MHGRLRREYLSLRRHLARCRVLRTTDDATRSLLLWRRLFVAPGMIRWGQQREEDWAIGTGPGPLNGFSPQPTRPLVISVLMAPPASNAKRYCVVQRRKGCDSERCPSLDLRHATADRTSGIDSERPWGHNKSVPVAIKKKNIFLLEYKD